MAPCKPAARRSCRAARKLGTLDGSSKGKIAPGSASPPQIRSALLLLDIVDDLGHVVLVLAELGGVFDQLLLFLFGLLEWHRSLLLFLVLGGLDFLGLQIGIDLLGGDRRQLLL